MRGLLGGTGFGAVGGAHCGGGIGDAIGERYRPANDHRVIVLAGDLVRHQEMEMHAEEIPPHPAVGRRQDRFLEARRPDDRIDSRRATEIQVEIADGIEAKRIQDILRRLIFDPQQRGFRREPGDMPAQPVGGAHKTDDRQARADRQ
ncbi:MAG: hypothetical protein E6G69_04135 [Alphaproteobacteria bacterium]|nr:MAG: hypothetical protein E6G69_04135 [Alphaproteobacteria bacterium]